MAMIFGSEPTSLEKRLGDISKIELKTRDDVLNVFTPNSPITSPTKFAGREKQIEDLLNALSSKGADLIIIGERGCGKTSLGYMLHDIAQGKLEILEYYGLKQHLEKKGFLKLFITDLFDKKKNKFNVIWVDAFRRTVDEVINAVLTRRRDRDFGAGLLSYIPNEADQIEISSKIGFDKVFTAEAEVKEVYIPSKPLNIKEGFELAMQRYADKNSEELLIIVDEFETVKDKSEIAQYLKSVKHARFVLMGIASTSLELIEQHASVARDTFAIELKPMEEKELREILKIGDSILGKYNYNFSPEAMEEIIKHSYGSPYWCHFIAKAIVQQELDLAGEFFLTPATPKRFTKEDVNKIISTLSENPNCKSYEELLKFSTFGDVTTAKILLRIAGEKDSTIFSTKIIDSLVGEGISREVVMATINDWLQMSDGPFEEQRRIRDLISFSFKDPNFKRYILLRDAGI
jgi:ABC-type oligopeptide transport system ATPase subunit